MRPADDLGKLIHERYILPAYARGETTVELSVLGIARDLGNNYRPDFIGGVLGSMRFRNTYHLLLAATKGSPERAPIAYTYKLRAANHGSSHRPAVCDAQSTDAHPRLEIDVEA